MKRFTFFFGVVLMNGCNTGPAGGGGGLDAGPTGPCTYWRDVDHDGYGDPAVKTSKCDPGPGWVDNDEDCDDSLPQVSPDTHWHPDVDQDGFGDPALTKIQCLQPQGYVLDATDCDDHDDKQHPGQTWYLDNDHDGYGRVDMSTVSCARPANYVLDGRDCDDGAQAVHPGTGTCPFKPSAAKSCKTILDDGKSEGDGAYLIDPDGAGPSNPYTVYCDMSNDGGGWTALLNPVGMPSMSIPNLSVTMTHVGGTSSTCSGNPQTATYNGGYGLNGYDCGNYTNAYSILWPNAFGAKDVKLVATLQGGVTHTLSINGTPVTAEASTTDHICQFFNGSGAALSASTPTNTCSNYALDAPPSVHTNAFTGALDLVTTVGAACQPNCTYGVGFNMYRLYVR